MLSTEQILKRLRAVREAKYLKQEYVARKMGIDRTTYIRKEKGNIPITTEEWLKLAHAMNKEPSYFFSCNSGSGTDAHLHEDPIENGCDKKELVLLELYRSLSAEERRDIARCLRVVLKSVMTAGVLEAIDRLAE